MNKGNTDLQAVVFKNTQTLLRKYLVKLKQFLVPADEKQGIPGPCAQAGAKAGHRAAAFRRCMELFWQNTLLLLMRGGFRGMARFRLCGC